jgi:hypothetical protein
LSAKASTSVSVSWVFVLMYGAKSILLALPLFVIVKVFPFNCKS